MLMSGKKAVSPGKQPHIPKCGYRVSPGKQKTGAWRSRPEADPLPFERLQGFAEGTRQFIDACT